MTYHGFPPDGPAGRGPDPYGHRGVPDPYRQRPPGDPWGHPAAPPPGYRARPSAPPPRRTPAGVVLLRLLSGLVATAILVVSGLAWAAVGGTPKNASDATHQAGDVGVAEPTDAEGNVIPLPADGMNILVVGTDARTDASGAQLSDEELRALSTTWTGGGVATDTMMIVHVPGGGQRATAVSIPRDTWIDEEIVGAPGVVGAYSDGTEGPYRPNKINSFYGSAKEYALEHLVAEGETDRAEIERRSSEAGRAMLIKVLQQFTGVKIHHYAEVNLIGFYLLSEAIGGVPVCLLAPVDEPKSGADFPAGHFEVEGSEALSFVRQRYGLPRGDLDRIRRQQAFLAGAADKILSVGTLTSPGRLGNLVDAANRSLVLDKDFDLLTFGQQMIGLTSGNINFVTIPTHGPTEHTATYALAVDNAEIRAFFAALRTDRDGSAAAALVDVAPETVIVDVQNGTQTPGLAAAVGGLMVEAGYQRGQIADYPGTTEDNQQAVTTVRHGEGGEPAARQVLAVLGTGELLADDDIPPGHVLVVVGTDMPRPNADGRIDVGDTPGGTASGDAAGGSGDGDAAGVGNPPLDAEAINAAAHGCVY